MLGIDVRSRKLVYFDPWLLRSLGIANSTYSLALGEKGQGKSALEKMLAMRLMTLTAGYHNPRIMINDYKPEGKESEYGALSKICRSKVFAMRNMRINPFEPRLFYDPEGHDRVSEFGILQMAKIICEFENDEKELTPLEHYALRIAVADMLGQYDASVWSPDLLERIAGSITLAMRDYYQSRLDDRLRTNTKQRLERVEGMVLKESVARSIAELTMTSWNYTIDEIVAGGKVISSLLGKALHGSYGQMFGARHSLYDTLTQRAVTKDWRGMDPRGESLMRIIDTTIRTSAMELNRTDLLPDVELDDEKHVSMGNIVYARTHATYSAMARGVKTFSFGGTHTFDSIRRGAVGSELYNLGEIVINNLAYVFYGKLPPGRPTMMDEIQRREMLSNSDRQMLEQLPPYTFGLKVGETEPMRFIRIIATQLDIDELIPSDSAAETMLDRPQVFSPQDMALYAKVNGIELVGERS